MCVMHTFPLILSQIQYRTTKKCERARARSTLSMHPNEYCGIKSLKTQHIPQRMKKKNFKYIRNNLCAWVCVWLWNFQYDVDKFKKKWGNKISWQKWFFEMFWWMRDTRLTTTTTTTPITTTTTTATTTTTKITETNANAKDKQQKTY